MAAVSLARNNSLSVDLAATAVVAPVIEKTPAPAPKPAGVAKKNGCVFT